MAGRRRGTIAILLTLVLGACATPALTPTAAPASPVPSASGPSATASASLGDARRADLDHLIERLERLHPNPFLDEGEAGFLARVDAIKARADDLSDTGFLLEVMRLMNDRPRDGHSGAWAFAQDPRLLHALPVWLWDFPDGLRIVSAQAGLEDLVGARVVRVGHTRVDDARTAVAPLVPHDNDSSLRGFLPLYLTIREIVEGLGLATSGEPILTVETLGGEERAIEAPPIPIDALRDWVFGIHAGRFPSGLPPDDDGPTYLRHLDRDFWTERIDDGRYVGYNEVVRADGPTTIGDLAAAIATEARDPKGGRLIIDLRNNGGGDNTTYASLFLAVFDAAKARPGRVALISGRGTFSAAGNFVTQLEVGSLGDAIQLVGEPPGGGLDIYGDVAVEHLSASGVVVFISRRYHEKAPGDDRLEVPPDVPIEVGWDDYAAGRDPVLDAAIEHTVER